MDNFEKMSRSVMNILAIYIYISSNLEERKRNKHDRRSCEHGVILS